MTEHKIQSRFFKDLEKLEEKYHDLDLFHAIPNGGKRAMGTAIKLKREGVKAGIPDTHLPVPIGNYASLYIEFKKLYPQKSYPKPHQRTMMDKLRAVGNYCAVAWSAGEAIAITEQYMRGEL